MSLGQEIRVAYIEGGTSRDLKVFRLVVGVIGGVLIHIPLIELFFGCFSWKEIRG